MTFSRTATLAASVSVLAGLAHADTLNIQTSFNAGDFSTQHLTETWLPKIAEMTDGRVEIAFTPNGSVVPAKETPEAVAYGVLDGDFTSVNYFSGREPAFALLGDLISGYDTPQQMLGFCKDGPGEAMMQKAADELTVLHFPTTGRAEIYRGSHPESFQVLDVVVTFPDTSSAGQREQYSEAVQVALR